MLEKHMAKVTYVCNISGSMHVAQTVGQKVFNGESFTSVSPQLLRMATPDECRKAWIEYIEPPARWLPIENAPMHTIRKGVRADGTVEGHYVETYYTPCKGIATENDGLYLRVVADNGATDIETRVLFSTLESDGWINPNEANNIRAQLAEAQRDSARYSFLKMMHKDWHFDVAIDMDEDEVQIIQYATILDTVKNRFVGATFDAAIDNAMKGGE